jgi:hypothetical protein
MSKEKLLQFPLRNPDLFSGEINRQVISTGEFARLLYAAIRALPHVKDAECREQLKRALCDLLFNADAAYEAPRRVPLGGQRTPVGGD